MAISFESIGQKLVSFKASATLKAGDPCILCANDTVMPANEGGEFCGIVSGVRGGVAGVIVGGCVTVPYTGKNDPAVGYGYLAADGKGGVVSATEGGRYLIVNVDKTGKTVTFFLNH